MATVKKKPKKAKKLTREDIQRSLGDANIAKFNRMLDINIYSYRIKLLMYKNGSLSPKGFFLNDDIFNLELGKKIKGKIHIDDGVLEIFDRFLLADNFMESGDALTAFLIDHNDELYNTYKKVSGGDEKIEDGEYLQLFNAVYNKVSNDLLDIEVNNLLISDKKLSVVLKEIQLKKN